MQGFDANIVSRIRERSAAMERRGEPEAWLLEKIYDEKLFKLFVPRELNGLGCGLPEALRVFERMAWIDGSLGWLVTIGAGGGFFAGTLPERPAAKLFAGREAVLAGSGMPTGTARKIDGGYIASGRWRYCSGATFATFFTANCQLEGEQDAAGGAKIRSFAFLPEQVRIVRDWNPLGLRATASHTIEVSGAFVPEERMFDIASPPRYSDPIFRYPFLPFAQASFAAASLGMARHFLDECREFAAAKADEWRAASPRRLAALERTVDEWMEALSVSAARFYDFVDSTWKTFAAEGSLPDAAWREIGSRSQETAAAARSASEAAFPLLGMAGLRYDEPLCRTWRDVHTVTQHSVLLPENGD